MHMPKAGEIFLVSCRPISVLELLGSQHVGILSEVPRHVKVKVLNVLFDLA
jgi:hypothetical protein